jgi:hypothetical protein
MNSVNKKNKKLLLLLLLLLFFLLHTNMVYAGIEDVDSSIINVHAAVMLSGQTKTFTAESDYFPDIMIIPVYVSGDGTLRVTVTKTDTIGEVIAVMQNGYGHPPSGYVIGITPCSLPLSFRCWEYGSAIVFSSLLFTLEPGPYKYTVTLSY